MKHILLSAVCAVVLLVSSEQAQAGIIVFDPGNSSVINRVTGLDVGGTLYDVDFTRAREIFNNVFGAGDPPSGMVPYFWTNPAGAAALRQALANLFDAERPGGADWSVGDAALSAWEYQIPTREPGSPLLSVFNYSGNPDSIGGGFHNDVLNRASSPPDYAGWAVVTLSSEVPEPGSLTLLGLGTVGLVGFARRRRQST
jgi:hypothetical protein